MPRSGCGSLLSIVWHGVNRTDWIGGPSHQFIMLSDDIMDSIVHVGVRTERMLNMPADHDLVALWEAHCRYEFETRDVDATMATMVGEPYVNHVPTMTGGVGHDQLKRFYKYHFIGGNPEDTTLTPVSRTVGADQIVDELLFSFTHTSEIDWMLPGVAPTGRRVEIPLVAIVRFQDGKVAHEHIYWDQASVLVQVGLLNPAGLPVSGVETARKVVDKSQPSNLMMGRWASSEGKPI